MKAPAIPQAVENCDSVSKQESKNAIFNRRAHRILTGLIAVVCSLSAVFSHAEPFGAISGAMLGAVTASQSTASDSNKPREKRQQANDLLRRARQAMGEGNLDAAESLISQADALNVQYGPFHFGDTPKKARRDLQRKRSASKGSPLRPSQLFAPLSLGKKKPPPAKAPFAARTNNPPASYPTAASDPPVSAKRVGSSAKPTFLPPINSTDTPRSLSAGLTAASRSPFDKSSLGAPRLDSPSAAETQLPAALNGRLTGLASRQPLGSASSRTQSGKLLLEARRALAQGDVRRAEGLIHQAGALKIRYGLRDDSPEKVQAAIDGFRNLKAEPDKRKNTESYRRQYARLLMQQAEALLRHEDYDTAEQLANQAAAQRVSYGSFETQPRNLLERIAAARRQAKRSAVSSPVAAAGRPPSLGSSAPSLAAKQKAVDLVRKARTALRAGQVRQAEALAREAERMQVPDSAFARGEDRVGLVLLDIQKIRHRGSSSVIAAGAQSVIPATGAPPAAARASHALYDRENDPTRNVPAASLQPGSLQPGGAAVPRQLDVAQGKASAGSPQPVVAAVPQNKGMMLFQQGEAALRAHDVDKALEYFRQAAARTSTHRNELDPFVAQRLQDHLQLLSVPGNRRQVGSPATSMIDEAAAKQQLLIRQINAEVIHQEANARKLLQTDPKGALKLLADSRKKVEQAGLEPRACGQLLRRIDRSLTEMRTFVDQNSARIELDERNRQVSQQVSHEQQVKLEVQEKLALMVDEFNTLMDEQRWGEAEVVAKRAAELDPDNPVVRQLVFQSKFVRRFYNNLAVSDAKERGFIDQLGNVDEAAIPFDDNIPFVFPDAKEWQQLTKSRAKLMSEKRRRRSPREIEIEQKLRTPVSLKFQNAPLSRVLEYLAKLAEVNLHVDPQGLAEEGVTSDTPVTINLSQEISLKSALNLILQPLHLSYVIKDEVLKITSEQLRDGEVYTGSYNVADLVVPIPNFIPSPRMGLAGAYHDALSNIGFGGYGAFGGGGSAPPLAVVASKDGNPNSAHITPNILAQMSGKPGAHTGGPRSMPMGFGPGGLGGGVEPDFDSLIELITTTIQPTTWDEVGGPGSIAPFETNLSLVVSQTQDVHEEIVDLLEQLRRLQDLQVTIEVRFITVNDNFFERIGVDFDFDISSNTPDFGAGTFGHMVTPGDPAAGTPPLYDTVNPPPPGGANVGLQAPGVFSADLDIPFTQNSYGLAVPQFGGFDATAGAQLGFAILSDIEAYFFINAAQGDRRTNVLQAPKVTLFNGQQAFVSDTSQSPFVISVIPVVGDFAAAQQPVIVVLSEGTFLTVQAVISNDRRFVRLTVVPFFSQIGDVETFQFTGSETTTTDTSAEGWRNDDPDNSQRENNAANTTRTRSGTTVQLPTFSFITVTTTVSVPDGGTVLLGGIKRLSEGRNEFGVPMLNKIPYINRLFKNVGIGRETQSLMMMVTPRIIIQEEEEERLGILP